MKFSYTRKIYYYETDKMGIVHHSNYIRWFEEARLAMLEEIGMTFERMEEMGLASPVIGVECDYKSMMRFGHAFLIETKVKFYDGIKLVVEYEVKDAAEGDIRAKGETRHCFINTEGRVVSLKRSFPVIHEVFMKYKGDEA